MHYDPYESSDSKKRRYISNIAITFVVLAMVAAIFALIFRDRSQIKYDFEKITTVGLSADNLSGDGHELCDLISQLNSGNSLYVNDDFSNKYPITASLFNMDLKAYSQSIAVYGKNDIKTSLPFIEAGKGNVTVAMCVPSKETGCRDLVASVYQISTDCKGSTVTFNITDSTDYCIRYSTRDANAPLRLLKGNQVPSLDIFRLTVKTPNENIIGCGYSYTLDRSFSEDRIRSNLYHQLIYDPFNSSYCNPDINSGADNTVISARQGTDKLIKNTDTVGYSVNYTDAIEPMIKQISLFFEYGTPTVPQFVLEFN